jgi:hypothetical protein
MVNDSQITYYSESCGSNMYAALHHGGSRCVAEYDDGWDVYRGYGWTYDEARQNLLKNVEEGNAA